MGTEHHQDMSWGGEGGRGEEGEEGGEGWLFITWGEGCCASLLNRNLIAHIEKEEKTPHTGDTDSLDRCG